MECVCNAIESAKLISVPFLTATWIIHALLPERNLHRIALMCHVFSLIPGYLLLGIGQYVDIKDDTLCVSKEYVVLFFMVSSFFWMNVICIDIYIAFSSRRGFHTLENKRKTMFAIAFLYAWGLPALNVFSVFLINTYADKGASYHPGVGVGACFLLKVLPSVIHYFGPIAVLTLINIVLFILTAANIRRTKKEIKMVNDSNSKKHSTTKDHKIRLYWKLLFIMGLNPIVNTQVNQLISLSVGYEVPRHTARYIWFFKDFSHAFYGMVIFVIFVCQKSVLTSIRERFPCNFRSKKTPSKASVVTTSTTI